MYLESQWGRWGPSQHGFWLAIGDLIGKQHFGSSYHYSIDSLLSRLFPSCALTTLCHNFQGVHKLKKVGDLTQVIGEDSGELLGVH